MKLSDRQWEFLKALGKLIRYAERKGYKLTGSDLQSKPGNTPRHSTKSFHYRRLANEADFQTVADAVQTRVDQGLVDVVTVSEWLRGMQTGGRPII